MAAQLKPAESSAIQDLIRRYYTVWWSYSFAGGFVYGIYALFLRSRGLNQFQINSVLAIYFVVIFATDVPTGAFADALGRRKSFVLGCALRVVGFTMYFVAHRYLLFALAEFIDGIGTTFCSGSIDAWGVDALDRAGFPELKDRLFSRISQLTNFGFMASAFIGAQAANVNIAWPWLLGAAGYLAVGLAAHRLMRDAIRHGARIDVGAIPARIAEHVGAGLRQGFGNRTVLLLSTANAIGFAAWAPYWLQWPQLFNDDYNVGIWVVGWIYCVLTIGRMLGAEAVARLEPNEAARGTRLSALALAASTLLFGAGLSGGRPNLALAVLFAMNLCIGAMQPLAQSWFNEHIAASERATLLSFNSTFSTLGGSLGLLYSGHLADAFGIPMSWRVMALVLAFAAPCYWTLRPRAQVRAAVTGTAK